MMIFSTIRNLLILGFSACLVLLLSSCVANPTPDIPQDLATVDSSRVRVDIAGGPDQLSVTGSGGAAQGGLTVQVQNLLTGTTVATPVASDGSFTATVEAGYSQILGLRQVSGGDSSSEIYIGGNAEREAVEIGDDGDCYEVETPVEGNCLVCVFEGQEEIVGCEFDDFSSEAPLNPANIAECLFLSTDVVQLEPIPEIIEETGEDFRWADVQIFNDCNELIFLELNDFESETPERFEFNPMPGGDRIEIEPTFFSRIEIFFNGMETGPDEEFQGSLFIDVFVPDELLGEFHLGSLNLNVIAPPSGI